VRTRTVTTPGEAAAITAICFGWAFLSSTQAVVSGIEGATFTDGNMLGLIGMEVVFGTMALLVLHLRGYALSSLYPQPSWPGIAQGIGLCIAGVLASWIVTAPFGTSQHEELIDALVSSAPLSPFSVTVLALVNGAYEEIFLLGFLLRGLQGYGLPVALGVSLLVRVSYHLYQGPLGALSVLAIGLVFSLYYIKTQSLFPVVFAHTLVDIAAFM
jgi:membrane protease YdiL (CAAX protease family)